MSRSGRGVVEHETASKIKSAIANMPEGVQDAVNKVRELNSATTTKKEPVKISEGLKNLIVLGKNSEDLVVGDYTFTMSTLSTRQQRELIKRLFSIPEQDRLINIKSYTLAEAIESVNKQSLESIYEGDEDLSTFDRKLHVILDFQASLVEHLFEFYENLASKNKKMFNSGGLEEDLKN